ncbi:MAG: UPF0721 transmembrane protein [Chitinophagales bacterium]|nr:MAG: UPF0721 transmembrane protein [Chitinophagales bacterium]
MLDVTDIAFLKTTAILTATGLVSGFINTVAGGGSLLTLPVLIFLGFASDVANGTNRVAIFFSSLSATYAFRQQGIRGLRYGSILGLCAMVGAIPGAWIALKMDDRMFEHVLAAIMFTVAVFIALEPLFRKTYETELQGTGRMVVACLVFFIIGIYGGFLQAGVGFLIIVALSVINKMNLVKSNNIKVIVTFFLTIVALSIFALSGKIDWKAGLILAVSQSAGGWAGSHWTVKKGEKWVRRVLLLMIIIMALKLLGVPFLNPHQHEMRYQKSHFAPCVFSQCSLCA